MPDIITNEEVTNFVDTQLMLNGFSKGQRRSVRSVCELALKSEDSQEYRTRMGAFFSEPKTGITEEELHTIIEELRDPDSPISKGLKYPIRKDQVDKLKEIMREALLHNKEHLF